MSDHRHRHRWHWRDTEAFVVLLDRLREAVIALEAAHHEEGVCSCPGEGCVLSNRWAMLILREPRP